MNKKTKKYKWIKGGSKVENKIKSIVRKVDKWRKKQYDRQNSVWRFQLKLKIPFKCH